MISYMRDGCIFAILVSPFERPSRPAVSSELARGGLLGVVVVGAAAATGRMGVTHGATVHILSFS
jgi:hypothetical protein